jgi:hypothetical protein
MAPLFRDDSHERLGPAASGVTLDFSSKLLPNGK